MSSPILVVRCNLRHAEHAQQRFGSSPREIRTQVHPPDDSTVPSETSVWGTFQTFLFTVPLLATRIPLLLPTTSNQDRDDQVIILLVTVNHPEFAVVSITAKRKLVLVARDLPPHVQSLWCSSRKRDYLVYARGQSPEHLIAQLQHALATVSPQGVMVGDAGSKQW